MTRMALIALASLAAGCYHTDPYECQQTPVAAPGYVAATPYTPVGTCGAAPQALAQTVAPPLLNAPVAATPAIRDVAVIPSTQPVPGNGIVQAGFTTNEPPR